MKAATSSATPMMVQFLGIKENYKDALLFYRMGDFYEMFFDDAVAAAEALDIALTKRGKHLGQDIPMCGVPVHAAERYLLSLISKGFRVAVCEQLENPAEAKKRGAKSVVKRDVVRLVTPGTLTEESLLDARKNNFLAAFSEVRGTAAIAWVDVSTGEFSVMPCSQVQLFPNLARLSPSELLVSENDENALREAVEETGAALTPLSRGSFDSTSAEKRLCALYSVKSLDGFGQFERSELSAMGAIVDYLELTQKGKLPLLRPPVREAQNISMQIDAATRRNLELTQNLSGGRDGSLLAAVDRTVTGTGGRLLSQWITNPSLHLPTIHGRLDAVSFFKDDQTTGSATRQALRKTPDMDRALSRLALERGGPRDLVAIRTGIEQVLAVGAMLSNKNMPIGIRDLLPQANVFDELLSNLTSAIIEEPPLLARDGSFVASGFNAELDDARELRDQGRSVIATMQSDYARRAEIPSLKIKHNNVLGYFIETPATHAEKMLAAPLSELFIHRQTTANAVRFTTVDLSEMETKILNSGGRALEIEKQVFEAMRVKTVDAFASISDGAKLLAYLDVTSSLADLALGENWSRPLVEAGDTFEIIAGRHPVVEQALKRGGDVPFVANDCDLSGDESSLWLLTGPNMAGKSTFLRQNALIALLAQIGSYVPAESARIGVVTQLFSRVGASDDLARGRSTFMVEMVETAAILNQADAGALVILDEIGRGTATYDGLSIAWATLEHLHDVNSCRTLFATHYHELTALSSKLPKLSNATVAVREWDGDVIFLHEVRKGAADRSYGIQVAKLAGLPVAVVDRARIVLETLEKSEQEGGHRSATLIDDLPLFAMNPAPRPLTAKESAVEDALKDVHPDTLTPKEALNLIYELRDLLKS